MPPQHQETADSFKEVLKEITTLTISVQRIEQQLGYQEDTLNQIRGELHGSADGSLQTQTKVLKERLDALSKSVDIETGRRLQLDTEQRSRNFTVTLAVITSLIALVGSITAITIELVLKLK